MRGTSHTGSYLGDLIPGNVLSSYISADLAWLVSPSFSYPSTLPYACFLLCSTSSSSSCVLFVETWTERIGGPYRKKQSEKDAGYIRSWKNKGRKLKNKKGQKKDGEVLKLLDPRSRKPTRRDKAITVLLVPPLR